MSIPRPKILSVITVPTGGWDIKVYISDAAQYDSNFTATIPAGDYFMAGDNQSDDFLFALQTQLNAGVHGILGVLYAVVIDIHPTAHKVRIGFAGLFSGTKNDIKIAWTESDSGVYETLGFDGSADDESTATDNPVFTADYHHAYGWYSDEDGQLVSLSMADGNAADVSQGRSLGGQVKTQFRGEYFESILVLDQIERNFKSRTKMLSNGKGYTEAPVYPYNRNEPLECWWREACQGKRFRVYRDGFIDTSRAADRGDPSATGATTVTDASKNWGTEPYRWKDAILYCNDVVTGLGATSEILGQANYIESHTATVITISNAAPTLNSPAPGSAFYYLFDHTYQTYVLDLDSMSKWDPDAWELPSIDRYSLEIPLLRYVA